MFIGDSDGTHQSGFDDFAGKELAGPGGGQLGLSIRSKLPNRPLSGNPIARRISVLSDVNDSNAVPCRSSGSFLRSVYAIHSIYGI
jgi:hypothetical protein